MPLTRLQVETELVNRTFDLLELVGISTQTDGANTQLNGAIATGVRKTGGAIADLSNVTDDEVNSVSNSVDAMLDIAEYRLLETCRNRWVKVRNRLGTQSEVYWSDIRDSLDRRLAEKRKQLETEYGVGLGFLEAGVIVMNNVTTDSTETAEL